ncbi:hypothetical protein KIN20_034573 [Parelaphostrongylus tenuis]|uniref:Uncharacterized protein n=1 Tax=Parelaphostrongylus tenuis TaxID=148309 RepID=A0AAD5RA72_PARTN|nr:hypothetical protein KIN20_034573 [Parelaphostrongylus tenuis]
MSMRKIRRWFMDGSDSEDVLSIPTSPLCESFVWTIWQGIYIGLIAHKIESLNRYYLHTTSCWCHGVSKLRALILDLHNRHMYFIAIPYTGPPRGFPLPPHAGPPPGLPVFAYTGPPIGLPLLP